MDVSVVVLGSAVYVQHFYKSPTLSLLNLQSRFLEGGLPKLEVTFWGILMS